MYQPMCAFGDNRMLNPDEFLYSVLCGDVVIEKSLSSCHAFCSRKHDMFLDREGICRRSFELTTDLIRDM